MRAKQGVIIWWSSTGMRRMEGREGVRSRVCMDIWVLPAFPARNILKLCPPYYHLSWQGVLSDGKSPEVPCHFSFAPDTQAPWLDAPFVFDSSNECPWTPTTNNSNPVSYRETLGLQVRGGRAFLHAYIGFLIHLFRCCCRWAMRSEIHLVSS